jgi:AmiR/NasT family two-component response regulator
MSKATSSLSVAVADDEIEIVEYLRDIIHGLGHTVTASCTSGDALVEACRLNPPELIITDVKMPGIDGIEAAGIVTLRVPTPVILVTSFCESDLIRRALCSSVLAYLMKPVGPHDLEVAIPLSMRRFREFQAIQDQATELRQSLEERKQIERAKGVLMRRAHLGEEEAFRRLQRMSTDQSQKMSETARMVIAIDKALRPAGFASEHGSAPEGRNFD